MKGLICNIILLFGLTLPGLPSQAENRMELGDLNIKGELHSDDRLRLLARERQSIKNHVKFRTNYRKEIVQGLLKPEPRFRY